MHAVLLLLAATPTILAASGAGYSTRYWDCCKPSCAWSKKASVSKPVATCDRNYHGRLTDVDAKSGCDNGSAFACANNSPFAVNDRLALTFTSGPISGKTMVVQSTNTGGDMATANNQFDLMIPGGGVGLFDGCSKQFGTPLPGARYGGVSSRDQCNRMPAKLKAGCFFRFDWFKNADNPTFNFKQIKCPRRLTAISGCVRRDDGKFPAASA
ncbi:hypothetical protein EsDP_00001321 [Epichloe bromicola]|uniref:Cellulase n=1 Tax=Epichloe bromicola TaxID=79588 RepID=A0ABQ0CHH7_9HYPO